MVGDSGFVAIPGSAIYSNYAEVRDMNKDMENMFATRTAALSVAEDALHTREEWFNRMLASLPDVAWTTSEDMRTIFISLNVEAMFGFSVAEIYANTANILLERIHPEDWPRVLEAYQALFTRGQRFDEEFRAQRKDGHWIWVHNRAIRTHREEGVLFADGILSDITARKEAEQARIESDQRYRLLFERNLAGVFRAEAGGKMLDCNPALVRMLGYDSAAELEGRTSAEILYEPEEESVMLESLIRNGAINNAEIRLRRKDGTALWGLHNVSLAPSDSRGPACIEGTVIDITQRRQSAEALQKQLSLVQAISTSAPDAMLVEDAGGLLRFINPVGERMLGYTMPELLGKVMHDVCHYKRIDGSPLPRSECAMAQAIASGKNLCGHEDVYFRRDGTPFYVSCSSAPMFEGGRLAGFVMVVQDITQRKLAEQQYQVLHEQFLHAQKMEGIGRLAGGIAHDFNNLLQIINGYSDLIEGECASNPRLAKRAQAIHEAGNRAARLTQELLDFSRKDQGAVQLIALGPAAAETPQTEPGC
jgi:two-component system cell cycle sensor histidine kinase/response regulator CckA